MPGRASRKLICGSGKRGNTVELLDAIWDVVYPYRMEVLAGEVHSSASAGATQLLQQRRRT